MKIAQITEQSSPLAALEALADNLKTAVESSWDKASRVYHHWDMESHFSPIGEHLGQREGIGEITINRQFSQPVRLSIRVDVEEEQPHHIKVFIHGIGLTGNPRIERLEWDQFHWQFTRGNISTDQVYNSIEYVEIVGVNENDKISVDVMDLSVIDQTLLLPLWAGIPDQIHASELVSHTILNEDIFWSSSGIKTCHNDSDQSEYPYNAVDIIWNSLIGEGLLRYGYRKEAAILVTKLMDVVISNLKSSNSFYNYFQSDSGKGIGERNCLGGLPPVGLFLKTLGVEIISPTKVHLEGSNPFPWPVILRFKGLVVQREKGKTKIVFPGGQSAIVKSPEKREVTLDHIS
jgi:hypothetical protein